MSDFPRRRGRPPKERRPLPEIDPEFVAAYAKLLAEEDAKKDRSYLNDATWADPVGHQPPVPPTVRERPRNEAGQYLFDLSLPVRGVMWGDLDGGEWDRWLVSRIKELWPQLSEAAIRGHMRGWCSLNGCRFVRCGNAAGLATVTRGIVGENPTVCEVFLFMANKNRDEKSAVRICREWQIWGATIGAVKVEIRRHSDAKKLADVLGATAEKVLCLTPRRQ